MYLCMVPTVCSIVLASKSTAACIYVVCSLTLLIIHSQINLSLEPERY